jgi:hypothetical protein
LCKVVYRRPAHARVVLLEALEGEKFFLRHGVSLQFGGIAARQAFEKLGNAHLCQ